MKDTLFVNLFGGPGISKSTSAGGIFSLLKLHGVDCEYINEYAKKKVWEGSTAVLRNQAYVYGNQYHDNWIMDGKVDVAVTDSPPLLSVFYDPDRSVHLRNLVVEQFRRQRSLNVLIERTNKYNPNGRLQTEEEARAIDGQIKSLLDENGVEYLTLKGDFDLVNDVAARVLAGFGLPLTYRIERT
jgi:hypothetical protein